MSAYSWMQRAMRCRFYQGYGFAALEVVEGTALLRPEPTPMFLALGSVLPR